MKIGKLNFKALEIDARTSIAADLTDEEARGIYAYEFTDGTWYVGKSIDVRDRHVQHMHEYKDMEPPLHAKTMYWAVVRGDDQQLDYAESAAIAWFESRGYSLRNVMKTGRPRGNMEVVVDTGAGWGVPIPWERGRLPESTRPYSYEEQPKMRERFEKLKKREDYSLVIATLARFVRNTIPAPADTAGTLWVVTALPSTPGRLCCISCQNVETLVLFKENTFGQVAPWGFVNTKPNDDLLIPDPNALGAMDMQIGFYENLRNCLSYGFAGIGTMCDAFSSRLMLDCCYRVNSELMRKGPAMFRRAHNPYLAEAIIEEASKESTWSVEVPSLKVSRDLLTAAEQLDFVGIEEVEPLEAGA